MMQRLLREHAQLRHYNPTWQGMPVDGVGLPMVLFKSTYELMPHSYLKHSYAQLFGLDESELHIIMYYDAARDDHSLTNGGTLVYTCSSATGRRWHRTSQRSNHAML